MLGVCSENVDHHGWLTTKMLKLHLQKRSINSPKIGTENK